MAEKAGDGARGEKQRRHWAASQVREEDGGTESGGQEGGGWERGPEKDKAKGAHVSGGVTREEAKT